eukprot:m.227135 g.227135  ORF g.227135 m.227135 type:complete len:126 (+) comp18813_c0_seq1:296-673(+)
MGEAIGAIRSLTNKAFEICILLVTVYILVELNQVPAGCDHSHVCLAAYLADGGDAEPDYIVPSCAVLREQCARGYAYYLFQGNAKSTLSAAEVPAGQPCLHQTERGNCDSTLTQQAELDFANRDP